MQFAETFKVELLNNSVVFGVNYTKIILMIKTPPRYLNCCY